MGNSGGIFLIQNDETLVELRQQSYDSEALLQKLLSRYPHLLAGDQVDSEAPRRWVLVSREMGVPREEAGGGWWSADHLFLDQDGIPTIVEVKRSSDTRIRREVVGQMLDYAANAVAYWPVEAIRSRMEARCDADSLNIDQVLAELVGADGSQDAFWQNVKTNLQAGRVRLVFVADEIPAELRRVVEFLNTQMDPAEVLAVEIKQYVGQGLTTLIPRVYGLTSEAQQRKAPPGPKRQWNEESFFAELASRGTPDDIRVARAIYDWATERKLRIWWGEGKSDGSFFPVVDFAGGRQILIAVWTYCRIEVQLQHMLSEGPLADEATRLEFVRRLRAIPGVEIADERLRKRPAFSLSTLAEASVLADFLAALDWAVEATRTATTA